MFPNAPSEVRIFCKNIRINNKISEFLVPYLATFMSDSVRGGKSVAARQPAERILSQL